MTASDILRFLGYEFTFQLVSLEDRNNLVHLNLYKEVEDWCRAYATYGYWTFGDRDPALYDLPITVIFRKKEDAVAFRLRFGL